MKRIFSLFAVLLCIFSLTSCTEPQKLDYTLLSEKLGEINPDYTFDFFDMIYYNDAYHVFLDLVDKDDVILSMTNEDGAVTSVTLTGASNNLRDKNAYEKYLKFVKDLLISFAYTDEKTANTVIGELNISSIEDYFKEQQHEYTFDRYKCTFSSNNLFITFCCEYFEKEEISTEKA